jgi:cysteinyl-tRNA synthetase
MFAEKNFNSFSDFSGNKFINTFGNLYMPFEEFISIFSSRDRGAAITTESSAFPLSSSNLPRSSGGGSPYRYKLARYSWQLSHRERLMMESELAGGDPISGWKPLNGGTTTDPEPPILPNIFKSSDTISPSSVTAIAPVKTIETTPAADSLPKTTAAAVSSPLSSEAKPVTITPTPVIPTEKPVAATLISTTSPVPSTPPPPPLTPVATNSVVIETPPITPPTPVATKPVVAETIPLATTPVVPLFTTAASQEASAERSESWTYTLTEGTTEDLLASKATIIVTDAMVLAERDNASQLKQSIDRLHAAGKKVYGYLSVGEAEKYRSYFQASWLNGNPPSWLGSRNGEWDSYNVRYWDPQWQNIVKNDLGKLIDAGFDGVYLDRVDVDRHWSNSSSNEAVTLTPQVAADRMIGFVEDLAKYAREIRGVKDFAVLPQNGEDLLAFDTDGSFFNTISGMGFESTYYNGTQVISARDINYRKEYLERLKNAGKLVLVVDYVDDGSGYSGANKTRIDDFLSRSRNDGYTPYVARNDRQLDEVIPQNFG